MLHRWNQHCAQAKSSKGGRWHFPNAIRKYGKDAFSHEVLEICHDLEVANLAEECWIEFYDTRNPEKGFNLAKGGVHTPHLIRKNPWTPQLRAAMSTTIRTTIQDPVVKANRQAACKRNWLDPNFRKKITRASSLNSKNPEVLRKISAGVKRAKSEKPLGPRVCRIHGLLSPDEYYVFSNEARICKQCTADRYANSSYKEKRNARRRQYSQERRDEINASRRAKYRLKNPM
jgi:hypothetical protein